MRLSKPAITTAVVLGLALIIGLWFSGNYNSLVRANNDVDRSWSKVETQYQRRLDLVGNLVSSVKGSQAQEQKVFGDIANARTAYNNASTPNDQVAAANQIDTAISVLPRLQEAYPELKSNENVQALIKELTGTENQIATARDGYNDAANNYNNNVQRFPKVLFANLFGYQKRTLFKASANAATAPEVKF